MRIKLLAIFILCALLYIGYYATPEKAGASAGNSSMPAILEKAGNSSIEKPKQQFVIIKADDFMSGYNLAKVSKWKRFFEYIEDKNLKASVGIIGLGLEQNLDANEESEETNNFLDNYLKNVSKRDTFEFWNHGYLHNSDLNDLRGENISEFWRTSYDYQKEHLLKTQELAKEKLNLTMQTFSAPCNKIDNNTVKALEDVSDIKVWVYGVNYSDKLVVGKLMCGGIFEDKSGTKNYSEFLEGYSSLNCDKEDILALQMHPGQWNDESFEQFKKIIDFLIEQNVTFINPYEYYELMQK